MYCFTTHINDALVHFSQWEKFISVDIHSVPYFTSSGVGFFRVVVRHLFINGFPVNLWGIHGSGDLVCYVVFVTWNLELSEMSPSGCRISNGVCWLGRPQLPVTPPPPAAPIKINVGNQWNEKQNTQEWFMNNFPPSFPHLITWVWSLVGAVISTIAGQTCKYL